MSYLGHIDSVMSSTSKRSSNEGNNTIRRTSNISSGTNRSNHNYANVDGNDDALRRSRNAIKADYNNLLSERINLNPSMQRNNTENDSDSTHKNNRNNSFTNRQSSNGETNKESLIYKKFKRSLKNHGSTGNYDDIQSHTDSQLNYDNPDIDYLDDTDEDYTNDDGDFDEDDNLTPDEEDDDPLDDGDEEYDDEKLNGTDKSYYDRSFISEDDLTDEFAEENDDVEYTQHEKDNTTPFIKPPEMKFFPSGLKNPVSIRRRDSTTKSIGNGHNGFHSDSVSSDSSSQQVPSTPSSVPPTPTTQRYSAQANVFQELPTELFESIRPLLIILKAQSQKVYYNWTQDESSDKGLQWTIHYTNGTTEHLKSLSLIGTQLQISTQEVGMHYTLPLVNRSSSLSNFQIFEDNLAFQEPAIAVSCNKPNQLNFLTNLCSLSIFESISAYKALTGTVISTMGLHLPDIHIILSSQYNFKDWCEIYIEGKGWVKAWCHINKRSNVKEDYTPKGKYQIKIYKDNKSSSPGAQSNLLCYIPDCDFVQDVFFYNQFPNYDDQNQFVQDLNAIKILGDVRFNNLDTIPEEKKKLFSPKRNVSTSSVKSNSSSNFETKHNGIIIRPIAHSGLPHLDSMIKFIIPIFDVTRKYGRPKHFKTSRDDKDSLMFGLPKLPHTNYFNINDISSLLCEKDTLHNESEIDDPLTYSMSWVTEYLNAVKHAKVDNDTVNENLM